MLIAVAPIPYEAPGVGLCPTRTTNGSSYDALGYVRVIKDGYKIAGGSGYYDPRTSVLTAWFPRQRPLAQVAMTLDLRPDSTGHIQIRTEGRGSIRLHHGIFCAYPEPPPKPSCDYGDGTGCPSPMPPNRGSNPGGRSSSRAPAISNRLVEKLR